MHIVSDVCLMERTLSRECSREQGLSGSRSRVYANNHTYSSAAGRGDRRTLFYIIFTIIIIIIAAIIALPEIYSVVFLLPGKLFLANQVFRLEFLPRTAQGEKSKFIFIRLLLTFAAVENLFFKKGCFKSVWCRVPIFLFYSLHSSVLLSLGVAISDASCKM